MSKRRLQNVRVEPEPKMLLYIIYWLQVWRISFFGRWRFKKWWRVVCRGSTVEISEEDEEYASKGKETYDKKLDNLDWVGCSMTTVTSQVVFIERTVHQEQFLRFNRKNRRFLFCFWIPVNSNINCKRYHIVMKIATVPSVHDKNLSSENILL